MFSYLMNKDCQKEQCEGILLYRTVDIELNAQVVVRGLPIAVQTLNLARPWHRIHTNLVNLILN